MCKQVKIMVTMEIIANVDDSEMSVDNVMDKINLSAEGDIEFVDVQSIEVKNFVELSSEEI